MSDLQWEGTQGNNVKVWPLFFWGSTGLSSLRVIIQRLMGALRRQRFSYKHSSVDDNVACWSQDLISCLVKTLQLTENAFPKTISVSDTSENS